MPEEQRHEIWTDPAARRFFEEIATRDEQVRIGEILRELTYEPYVDDDIKFPFRPRGTDIDLVLYYDGEFWIIYEILGSTSILVRNIGFEEEIPSVERGDPHV